ncbi:hypothetical protein Zmor_005244 [Zophobas morio]|uniref:Uncharacterized protein n=1 Tax=Zophobas morio TaxID=2755281 RepID=A0AA38ISY7_9CUCU|nr:hypothetical protein Zmor_005244 [Zophobas morio]
MDMFSSLKLLKGRSSSLLKDSLSDTLSAGEKCPLSNFTTWSYDVIRSQWIVVSLVESIRQVQGTISFHMGQCGMPTDRPRMERRRADIFETSIRDHRTRMPFAEVVGLAVFAWWRSTCD